MTCQAVFQPSISKAVETNMLHYSITQHIASDQASIEPYGAIDMYFSSLRTLATSITD
jgi:hypothetical protein